MRFSKLIIAIIFCAITATLALVIAYHVPPLIRLALAAFGLWHMMLEALEGVLKALGRTSAQS